MLKDITSSADETLCAHSRVIRFHPNSRPREMLKSLQTASEAIRNGEVVCIFCRGQITRIGQLLPFQRGLETHHEGRDAPIVPVALDGVWGSPSSFKTGTRGWRLPPVFRIR